MHKPESVQEKETQNFRDFAIQKCHLIPARRSDQMIINKQTNKQKKNEKKNESESAELWILPSRWTLEWKSKKTKKRDEYLDIARELK